MSRRAVSPALAVLVLVMMAHPAVAAPRGVAVSGAGETNSAAVNPMAAKSAAAKSRASNSPALNSDASEASGSAVAIHEPPSVSPSFFDKPLPAGLLLGGGALVVGAIVLQVLSSSAWGEFNAASVDSGLPGAADVARLDAIQGRARTEHALALVSGLVGAAAMFTGALLLWQSKSDDARVPPTKVSMHLAPGTVGVRWEMP